jgi:hypothetical protein
MQSSKVKELFQRKNSMNKKFKVIIMKDLIIVPVMTKIIFEELPNEREINNQL